MTNSELIKNHIHKLKNEISTLPSDSYRDEHLFGGVCVKNEFDDGKSWSADQWNDTFTDAGSDGGIDWITSSPEEDNIIKFVQCKFVQNPPSSTSIKADLTKLIDGSHRLERNDNTLNEKVTNVFDIQSSLVAENYTKEFHLFYSSNITPGVLKQAQDLINAEHSSDKFIIHVSKDIESKILMNLDESPYVEEDKITFYNDQGVIKNENGLVLNISAKSLRSLFKRKKSNGLFAQNLRKFITKKSVDSAIDHTLQNQRDSFWERNNGIIITCSDYDIDGNQIKLYKFSIVNGCQTTNRIGRLTGSETDFKDFPIVCKIIPCDQDVGRVEKIAEASNKQKAINPEDLKANSREQKELKHKLQSLTHPVSIQIKKGEPHSRPYEIKTTNKELGKLILACYLQKPGTARSATSKIFGDEPTYESIYLRDYTASNYRDLLRLDGFYKDFCKKGRDAKWKEGFFPFMNDEQRLPIQGLSSHAKYMILAYTILLIKIRKDDTFNVTSDIEHDIDLQEDIFNKDRSDDFEVKLYKLWIKILSSYSECYISNYIAGKTTGTSNFCKSDKTYKDILLPKALMDVYESIVYEDELNLIMSDVFGV